MIEQKYLLQALTTLGDEIRTFSGENDSGIEDPGYLDILEQARIENPWFITSFSRQALQNIADSLLPDKLEQWLSPYGLMNSPGKAPKTVGLVLAGNVPLVGFHDFISVLCSGNHVLAKLSAGDSKLLPFIARRLISFYPELEQAIEFTDGKLAGFDAVIATGSNNTARYFDYYFGKYPHIIRKNRNGVAVLSGDENLETFNSLGMDVFLYFGMGCRNVSKLYVPAGYDFAPLLKAFDAFGFVAENNKYVNNYEYYRSIYLINRVPHLDNGCVMLKEDVALSSPPSVLYYEFYDDLETLKGRLQSRADEIQCVVADPAMFPGAIRPGKAQQPELWEYADGVDTVEFLMGL